MCELPASHFVIEVLSECTFGFVYSGLQLIVIGHLGTFPRRALRREAPGPCVNAQPCARARVQAVAAGMISGEGVSAVLMVARPSRGCCSSSQALVQLVTGYAGVITLSYTPM